MEDELVGEHELGGEHELDSDHELGGEHELVDDLDLSPLTFFPTSTPWAGDTWWSVM